MRSPTLHRRWTPALTAAVATVAVVSILAYASFAAVSASGEAGPAVPERPDSVLLVGDSLLHQSRGEIDERFEDAEVSTGWLGGPGEGLLTDQSAWLDQIDQAVATFDPDAVVIEACCNYAQHDDAERYLLPDGTPVERDSETMYALWERAARDAVQRAGAEGAEVYVVVSPSPVDGTFFSLMVGARMDRFAATWLEIAADHPSVHVIDWRPAFTTDGRPVTVLPELGQVRSDDGLHVVGAGHDLLASLTVSAVVAPDA